MPPFVTARRPTRTQGEFWDVKPYRWMSELQERYTTNVMVATRKRSETIAKEATEWMQQNAPWQDITGEARKGLRAMVVKDGVEESQYASMMAEAINADQNLRDELDAARKERKQAAIAREQGLRKGRTRERYLRIRTNVETGEVSREIIDIGENVPPNKVAARRLARNIKTQKQYRRVTSVPKGRSAVAQFQRQWKGQRSPLIEVRFRHNPKVTYAIWLEIARQGRYAIISRAVNYWGKKLFNEVKMIANLKQYRDKIAFGPEVNAEQEFWSHVDRETSQTGKQYEAWSPRKQRERAQRRAGYDSAENKRQRARRTRQAERAAQPKPTRKAAPVETYQTWTPTRRSR